MRTKIVAVIGALAVGLVLLQPAAVEGAGRQRTKLSVKVSDTSPSVGQRVTVSGRVKPRKAAGRKRTIKLQQRAGRTWRTIKKKKVHRRGYRFGITPQRAGKVRYRLKVTKARGVKGRKKTFKLKVRGLPSRITARYSRRKVKLGTKVTVRGTVTGAPKGRRVTLYRALPSGARKVRSTTVGGKGRYRMRVPTGFLVKHDLFVKVHATSTRAAASSPHRRFTVTPDWKRQGRSTAWKSLKTSGRHVRVNPCAPVRYRVNLKAMKPKGRKRALRDLKAATRRITRATGIPFQRVGHTGFVPRARKKVHRRYPKDATLVVSWARQKQTKLDFNPAAAWGGGGAVAARGASGSPIWLRTKGWVVLEHPSRVGKGFANGARRGPLLMHEIGHVIGLDHPKARNQIMSAVLNPRITSRWSAGDVRGLRAKGIDHGCISRPRGARTTASEIELEPHPVRYAGRP